MAKFVCTVCGYIYEGEQAPAECPICHAGADKFKKVEESSHLQQSMSLAYMLRQLRTIQRSAMRTRSISTSSSRLTSRESAQRLECISAWLV